MADPLILNPTLTLAGQAAAFNANNTGIELILDAVSFGRGHYNPTGNEVSLVDPVGSRVSFAGGSRPTPYQLRISAAWNEDVGEVGIGEIGFWSGDTLVFVWSLANGTVASYKTDGVAYVLMADIGFAQVPAGSISLVIDSNIDAALAALSEHEGAANAHPQYLLRADVAKDAGPLMGLVHAAGSAANTLVLELDAPESKLPALSKFQRFQFVATSTNTGPVTVNIEGLGVKSVKRGGDNGLIELDAGDIKAGSLYDLNYDGASFQLGGGVGSGKAFERYSFTASVAQKDFPAPHVPGSIIVLHNGREIIDYTSALDGSKVTFAIACNINDSVEILAFKSFKVADGYSKAEVQALMKTASGMPVGGMLPVPKGVVPIGYLELDGSVKSIATYPDLAAYLGTTFNKGDEGAGNFRLPESRGEFLRGWDHGRGVDAGRGIGSWQADDNKAHNHATVYEEIVDDFTAGPVRRTYVQQFSAADSVVTKSSGGAEARPRNLAVMWCIKAWNAPVNQGQIDVAALAAELEKMKSAVPVGALMPFPAGVVPPGYLEADGSLFIDALYPDLAAYLSKKYNVAGDPAASTRLPDTRGEFLRGWDHGRGVDAGRAVGSWQDSQNKAHTHTQGAVGFGTGSVSVGSTNYAQWGAGNTGSSGGDEARPRNLAVMWCIKAWNTPVNQGTIDIAVLSTQVTELAQNGAVVGTTRNAKMAISSASASGVFTADEVTVEDVNGKTYRLKNFNQPINLASAVKGLGAMDTGGAPISGYAALYALFNPETKAQGMIAVNASATAAPELCAGVIPAGYTASALLAVHPTNSSGQFVEGVWDGRDFTYSAGVQVLSTNAIIGANTALNVPGVLPRNAKTVSGSLFINTTGTSAGQGFIFLYLYLSSSVACAAALGAVSNLFGHQGSFSRLPVTTPQTLFYQTGGPVTPLFKISVQGFTI